MEEDIYFIKSRNDEAMSKAVLISDRKQKYGTRWIHVDSLISTDMRDVKKISFIFERSRFLYPVESPYEYISIELKNDSRVYSNVLSHSLGTFNLSQAQSASHYRSDNDSVILGSEYFDRDIALYYHKAKIVKKSIDSLIKAKNLKYVDIHVLPSIYDGKSLSTFKKLEPFLIFSPMSGRKKRRLEKAIAIYKKEFEQIDKK